MIPIFLPYRGLLWHCAAMPSTHERAVIGGALFPVRYDPDTGFYWCDACAKPFNWGFQLADHLRDAHVDEAPPYLIEALDE